MDEMDQAEKIANDILDDDDLYFITEPNGEPIRILARQFIRLREMYEDVLANGIRD